jgi:hypothetical protein
MQQVATPYIRQLSHPLFTSLLLCGLLCAPAAIADSSFPLSVGGATGSLTIKAATSTLTLKHPNAQVAPRLLKDPPRFLVEIDAVSSKAMKEKKTAVPKNSCIQKIRQRSTTTTAILVLDLVPMSGDGICSISQSEKDGAVVVNFSLINAQTPTPVPTITAIPSIASTTVPTQVPTQVPTDVPTVTPTITSTSTPTVIATIEEEQEPTAIPEETATAAPTISEQPSASVTPLQPSLLSIDFVHDAQSNQVVLRLTDRFPFRMSKESNRKYKLTINGLHLGHDGLRLPQFPPNEVAGFTLVQAQDAGDKLEVQIAVDDGMKATAVNIDSAIVITAKPAGF